MAIHKLSVCLLISLFTRKILDFFANIHTGIRLSLPAGRGLVIGRKGTTANTVDCTMQTLLYMMMGVSISHRLRCVDYRG